MEFQLDLIDLLFLFSAGLGLFTTVALIFQKSGEIKSKFVLSGLLILLTFILGSYLLEKTGLLDFNFITFLSLQAFFLSLGPLLYFYICQRLGKDFSSSPFLKHLIFPISFFTTVLFMGIFGAEEAALAWLKSVNVNFVFLFFSFTFFHLALYCFWSDQAIKKEMQKPYRKKDDFFLTKIKWLKRLNLIFLILCIVIGSYYLALMSGIYYSYSKGVEWLILISTAICIQTIALHAIWYPQALTGFRKNQKGVNNTKSGLDKIRVQQYMNEQQPYKTNGLKLSDLAGLLNTNSHELSYFLNEEVGMSFFDFINSYRIKEAKEQLVQYPDKTILMTAYDVGFNSKTTFNRAFKKHVHMTPKEFRLKNSGSTL